MSSKKLGWEPEWFGEDQFDDCLVEKIKKFVLAGGFFFSEDWIVKEFVEKAFPKFIEAGFKLPDHNVTIAPVRGMATSGWKGRSYSLGIADAVTVLAQNAAAADAAATLIANSVTTYYALMRAAYESQKPYTNRSLMDR